MHPGDLISRCQLPDNEGGLADGRTEIAVRTQGHALHGIAVCEGRKGVPIIEISKPDHTVRAPAGHQGRLVGSDNGRHFTRVYELPLQHS